MITNIEFYCPNSVEFIFDFFHKFNINTSEHYNYESKNKVLHAIKELLNKEILTAGSIIEESFEPWNLSTSETINKIDNNWKNDAEFPDLYNIVYFRYQNWYIDKLNDLGFMDYTDWNKFIDDKVINLKLWIEENKPE